MSFQKKKGKQKKKTRNLVKVPYSPAKVKARNFLNKISYRRDKKQDFSNYIFIVDIFTYLIKNFNPFFLGGKFNNDFDQEMVKILWEYSMPKSLYDYLSCLKILKNYVMVNILTKKIILS